MRLLAKTLHDWWQSPNKAIERKMDRRVSFLELFYDLVYVVLIAEMAHSLASDITFTNLANFVMLFLIVWWAWSNGTTYHDIHGNNDVRTRFFTFLQMFTVIGMAIFAHDALGESSVGFAISYALFQLILTFLWWRTGVHDPDHRPLSHPYAFVFLINTLLFAISAFVPTPERFYIWATALLFSLILPLAILGLGKKNPLVKTQIDVAMHATPSLVERMGLFTIIVLGEVIFGIVSGASHQSSNPDILALAFLGSLIAVGIWWIYFDFISHRLPKPKTSYFVSWFYLHLPLTLSIATAGAAILNLLEHSADHSLQSAQLLLFGSLAIILLSITVLIQIVKQPNQFKKSFHIGSIFMIISAFMLIGLNAFTLGSFPILLIAAILLLIPVFAGFISWLRLMVVLHNH